MKKVWEKWWEEVWQGLKVRLKRKWGVERWNASWFTMTWQFSMPDDFKTKYAKAMEEKGPNNQ